MKHVKPKPESPLKDKRMDQVMSNLNVCRKIQSDKGKFNPDDFYASFQRAQMESQSAFANLCQVYSDD